MLPTWFAFGVGPAFIAAIFVAAMYMVRPRRA